MVACHGLVLSANSYVLIIGLWSTQGPSHKLIQVEFDPTFWMMAVRVAFKAVRLESPVFKLNRAQQASDRKSVV